MMQTAYDGVVFGALYALMAIGIVLIYRATGVLNLAQGAIAATGGYLAWYLAAVVKMPLPLAMLLATICGGLIGAVCGAVTNFLMSSKSPLVQSVATFGIAMIIQWSNRLAFGTRPRRLDAPLEADWSIAGVVMNGRDLSVVVLGSLVILCVYLLINYTSLGLRMRALAEDKITAKLYGISEWRIVLSSWFFGGALAAVSGVLIAIFIQIDHLLPMTLTIQSFGAMVLGGFGSVGGALLGGIVLGLVSSFVTVFLSSDLKNAIILGFVLIVLIVRPSGLLGVPKFKVAEGREVAQGPGLPGNGRLKGLLGDWIFAAMLIAAMPVLATLGFPIPMITMSLLVSTAIAVMGVSFIYYFQHRISLGQGAFVTFCVYFLHVIGISFGFGPSIPILILSVLMTSVFAALIGWVTLRLDGFYFAVTTLFLPFGLAEVLGQFGKITNGQTGITSPEVVGLANSSSEPTVLLVQAAVAFLAIGAVLLVVLQSRLGRIWVAVRDTPEAVEATGINPVPYRVLAFGISGAVAAAGGYLVALTLSFTSPEQFGMHWSILLLLATFAGGSRLLMSGSLIGAAVIILVPQFVSERGGVSDMMLGAALLVVLAIPGDGLRGLLDRLRSVRFRRSVAVRASGKEA